VHKWGSSFASEELGQGLRSVGWFRRSGRARVLAISVAAVFALVLVAGCGGGSGASGGGDIRIGYFAPESGFAAADGKSSYDAAKLAVKHINADGGIEGRNIELVNYDDASDPKQAVSIATKLTSQDDVTSVVSGSYSDQTLAAAPIFQRASVPMIAAYAVNPGIPLTGDYIFQQDFTGTVQGRAGAIALADKLGAKKIAIVAVKNDFGEALVKGFTEQAKKLGAEVVATDYNQFGEKDFDPIIKRDLNRGADGFYMVQYAAEGQQFISAWNQLNVDLPLVGTEGIDSTTQFLQPVGKDADGMVFTTSLDRESNNPATRKFIKDYASSYGHEPDMVAATTYDSFFVLAHAMKTAGTDPSQIKEGIAGTKNFDAVTGTILKYNDTGQVIKAAELQQIKNGKVVSFGEVSDPAIITP
jgi:branched-chain amino acid transport system substrate-binding protein